MAKSRSGDARTRDSGGQALDRIVCADAIEFLDAYDGPPPKLIFADPPFNIGYQYDRYRDELPDEAYVRWTEDWMRSCCRVLDPAGSLYVAIGDEYAADVCLIGKRKLGLTLRNWIIWHYTFGQSTRQKFARAHAHIFYFVKDPDNFTFNDQAVRVPSDRQLHYNDRRANPRGKLPDDVWTMCDECYRGSRRTGPDGTDVWTYSRVCGTFNERVEWHPCQMPEKVLERIILASSNPGDLVFDPFAGSGTTLVVAKRLARRCLGTDTSPDYVANATKRLDATAVETASETARPPEPFLAKESVQLSLPLAFGTRSRGRRDRRVT